MQNKNPTRFYYKEETKQGYEQNTPKIGVEQIKCNKKFYLYLYLLGT
jgi:hypothetical protein